ncbi:hypothetical protein MNBD_ALPHA01-1877 [hydrothermal vent metagenome]|uniref:Flagellar protein FlgJ N-terminal domain-containing protein n=1 Tax=hydrothermal vent metagenome TaxID=652676 RepID=A0A3B0SIS2_9ZZZZ
MDMKFLDVPPPQGQVQRQVQRQVQAQVQNQPATAFEKKARETAESFEAVFLSQILKSMSMGIKTDGPFGGGHGEDIFRDVLNEEIANQISRNGGIGLSDAVYREILKNQEVGNINAR